MSLLRLLIPFVALVVWVAPPQIAHASTLSFGTDYLGRTSRGGVNQSPTYIWTGSSSGYGDVWNSSFVFDMDRFGGDSVEINSARLSIVVHSFYNDRMEDMTFSIGSFTGSIDRLTTLATFGASGTQTDRSLYASMMATTYGATAMPAQFAQGDVFEVDFNQAGLDAMEAVANSTSSDFAMAGSFGYPTWQGSSDQLLVFTSASLTIDYDVVSPTTVPLPSSAWLMLLGLGGLSFVRNRRA